MNYTQLVKTNKQPKEKNQKTQTKPKIKKVDKRKESTDVKQR